MYRERVPCYPSQVPRGGGVLGNFPPPASSPRIPLFFISGIKYINPDRGGHRFCAWGKKSGGQDFDIPFLFFFFSGGKGFCFFGLT